MAPWLAGADSPDLPRTSYPRHDIRLVGFSSLFRWRSSRLDASRSATEGFAYSADGIPNLIRIR